MHQPLVLELSYFSNSPACSLAAYDAAATARRREHIMSEPWAGDRCVDRQTLYDELWQLPGLGLRRVRPPHVDDHIARRNHDVTRCVAKIDGVARAHLAR